MVDPARSLPSRSLRGFRRLADSTTVPRSREVYICRPPRGRVLGETTTASLHFRRCTPREAASGASASTGSQDFDPADSWPRVCCPTRQPPHRTRYCGGEAAALSAAVPCSPCVHPLPYPAGARTEDAVIPTRGRGPGDGTAAAPPSPWRLARSRLGDPPWLPWAPEPRCAQRRGAAGPTMVLLHLYRRICRRRATPPSTPARGAASPASRRRLAYLLRSGTTSEGHVNFPDADGTCP